MRANRLIVKYPFWAAVSVAAIVQLLTFVISMLLHPEGIDHSVEQLWLAPLIVLISYLFTFLPISKAVQNKTRE